MPLFGICKDHLGFTIVKTDILNKNEKYMDVCFCVSVSIQSCSPERTLCVGREV